MEDVRMESVALTNVKEVLGGHLREKYLENQRTPTFDEDLFTNGVLDSLSFLNVVMFVEDQFGISFAKSELQFRGFMSIDAIAAKVEAKLQAKANA
jgi:acyl carrier protein